MAKIGGRAAMNFNSNSRDALIADFLARHGWGADLKPLGQDASTRR